MVKSSQQKFALDMTAALRSRLSRRRLFFSRISDFGRFNQTPTRASLVLHSISLIVLFYLMLPVKETNSFLYILLLINVLVFVRNIIRFIRAGNA